MKVGDLIKIRDCKELDILHPLYNPCYCFFCSGKSNRFGVVLGPAHRNKWNVMFDCGEAIVDDFDVANGNAKVINESR